MTTEEVAPVEPATPQKTGVGDEEIDAWLGSASKAPIPAQNQAGELPEQIAVANTPELSHQNITQRQTKDCPFCAEPIAVAAIKCKHCGEMLDAQGRQKASASRDGARTTHHESYSDEKIELRDSSLHVKKFYNPLTRQELTSDSSLSYSEITSVNTTRGAICGVANYLEVSKQRRIFSPAGVGLLVWAFVRVSLNTTMRNFDAPVMEMLLGAAGFFFLCVPLITEARVKRGSKEVDLVTIKFSSGKDTAICYEPGEQVNKVAELIRARVN